MQFNSVCAKKLLLKSEHFHSKSNCFRAPQIGISSMLCCKSDFTVISLYSSLDFPFLFTTLPPPLFQNPHQIAMRFVHYFSAEQCATCTALGLQRVSPGAWTNCARSRSTLSQVLLRLQACSAKCWTLSSCRAVFFLPVCVQSLASSLVRHTRTKR